MSKRGRSQKKSQNPPIPLVVPPEPEFDRTRFVSVQAEKFYNEHLANKFNVERGFDWESVGMKELFTLYKWKSLAARPKTYAIAIIVMDFYANLFEQGDVPHSFVLGAEVPFTSTAINRYYSMSDSVKKDKCEFQLLVKGKSEKEHVVPLLPMLSVSLGVEIDPEWYDSGFIMKTNLLSFEKAALHRFICERIMPSSHIGEVNWKRAVLMHVVLNKKKINTGAIIRQEILKLVKKTGRPNFNFPVLITDLAKAEGVIPPPNGLGGLLPKATITRRSLQSYNRGASTSGVRAVVEEELGEPIDPHEGLMFLAEQVGVLESRMMASEARLVAECETNRVWRERQDQRQEAEFAENRMWRARLEAKIDTEFGEAQVFRQMMVDRMPPTHIHSQHQSEPSQMEWQRQILGHGQQYQCGPWDQHLRPPQ